MAERSIALVLKTSDGQPSVGSNPTLSASKSLVSNDAATMAYNKDQWISSFEDQMTILRPHLTERILTTMSLTAWHRYGRNDEDPIAVAREASKALDQKPKGR